MNVELTAVIRKTGLLSQPRRLSEKQKEYLDANFNTGKTSGRKLDEEVDAREMRRENSSITRSLPDDARIFNFAES